MDPVTEIIISSIVNFGVVAAIIAFAGKKALPGMVAKRSDDIAALMQEAEASFKEAEASLQKWETNFNSSKAQAEQLQLDAENAIRRLRENTLEAAKSQVQRMEGDSKLFAASERKRAQQSLLREMVERSSRLVDDHFSEQLGDVEGKRLVAKALESV